MNNLAAIKGRTGSRIPERPDGLALLDATLTGTKARDLETKLHRLIIGQEEAIHKIVRHLSDLSRWALGRWPTDWKLPVPWAHGDREDPRRGGDR